MARSGRRISVSKGGIGSKAPVRRSARIGQESSFTKLCLFLESRHSHLTKEHKTGCVPVLLSCPRRGATLNRHGSQSDEQRKEIRNWDLDSDRLYKWRGSPTVHSARGTLSARSGFWACQCRADICLVQDGRARARISPLSSSKRHGCCDNSRCSAVLFVPVARIVEGGRG